jgi:integrase
MADLIKPAGRFRGAEIVDARRKHLEPDEVKAFFDGLRDNPFWLGYFTVDYYYGCRMSEVSLILNEDVSFKTNEIIIKRLKKPQWSYKLEEVEGKKPKRVRDLSVAQTSGFREQVYQMPEKVAQVLGAVPHNDARNPFFFASSRKPRKGDPLERMSAIRRIGNHAAISRASVRLAFRKAAKTAGIPPRLWRSHVLRHTRATLMLATGTPEEDVKFLLDHASINTTRGYLGVAKSLRMRLQTSAQLGLADFL